MHQQLKNLFLCNYTGLYVFCYSKFYVFESIAFSNSDVCAAYNIGKLLGERCKMAGILNCKCVSPAEGEEKSLRVYRNLSKKIKKGSI